MTPTTQPQQRLNIQNAHDYREDYANSVMVKGTLWDMQFLFGRIDQTSPETLEVRQFAAIYVSPQQAKAMLAILQQNVAEYERQFGTIAIAPVASPLIPGSQRAC
ncbi:MAG: DUF3467 domain-containing protein [Candidatus Binataceae bacterium]|nr:DUF3467 domain-containing protein [Candidatus Binataceae bacterium]